MPPVHTSLGDTLLKLCFGALLGIAISHIAVVADVKAHGAEIQHLQQADRQLREDMENERRRNDERIFKMVTQIEKVVQQNSDLITLWNVTHGKP